MKRDCVIVQFLLSALLTLWKADGRPTLLLDLTHELNNNTLSYPTHVPFQSLNRRVVTFGLIKFATGEFLSSEHSGTHMDSPVHFAENLWTITDIPIDHFEGPAVVINITHKVQDNPDAEVMVDDLEAWEKENGKIPNGSIILMNSGYSKYFWTNATAYFGAPKGQTTDMHYPGFHPDACQWLIDNRDIVGVGVDTVSGDHGPATEFPCHLILSKKNKFILENLANVHDMPATGAILRAYPLKMTGATGSPSRVIATLPQLPKKN